MSIDRHVQDSLQGVLSLSDSGTTVGVVAYDRPYWHWFIGRSGTCKWTLSKRPPLWSPGESKPNHLLSKDVSLTHLLNQTPTDIVALEDIRPRLSDPFWQNQNVKVVMWQHRGGRPFRPPGTNWRLISRELSHADIGGVTDGVFKFQLALRTNQVKGGFTWEEPIRGLRTRLGSVLDPTTPGRKKVRIERLADPTNTFQGLLSWKGRRDDVLATSVFYPRSGVKRKLSDREMGAALDFPGSGIKRLKTEQLRSATWEAEIPGKIVSALFKAIVPLEKEPRDKVEKREGKADRWRESGASDSVPVSETKVLRTGEENSFEKFLAEVSSTGSGMSTVTAKATKSDDAKIPTQLWNRRVLSHFPHVQTLEPQRVASALRVLRRLLLKRWRENLEVSFAEWMDTVGRFRSDRDYVKARGLEALVYSKRCDWWEWKRGSALFFWRWSEEYLEDALNGVRPRFIGKAPNWKIPQPPFTSENEKMKVAKKVLKVLDKGYIQRVEAKALKSLMFMFSVPKGDDDIRMVYDGSKSGLNGALYAPWFSLPTIETLSRTLLPGYWCGDNDFGEQFLNFPMHPDLQPYCGVDLTQILDEKTGSDFKDLHLGVWKRQAMGICHCPYGAVQGTARAKIRIMGNRHDPNNPLQWEEVCCNLPGSDNYDPRLPWVAKYRRDGKLAADLHTYIDDVRTTGPDEETTWKASSQVAKTCSYLGLQDAARKRRAPSRKPGAWAGSVVSTENGLVCRTVTQERWTKARGVIRWFGTWAGLRDEVQPVGSKEGEPTRARVPGNHLPFKAAESHRGFLIYVSRTYPSWVPYLKGIHLTLDSWRPNRDEDGWRITNSMDRKLLGQDHGKAPEFVKMVPRFKGDVKALMELTRSQEPPEIPTRSQFHGAAYMVGDASGSGFGTSLWFQGKNYMSLEHGTWTEQVSVESSSNFRELLNLVRRLEHLVDDKTIPRGTEMFVFTDNYVAERTFYNGTSKSKLLHSLVLRLRKLEMKGSIFIHFVWIAGTRMISQGTDGLSRGDLTSGVMAGGKFLSHIPIHLEVGDRSPALMGWMYEYLPNHPKRESWLLLGPTSWYERSRQRVRGCYVWTPAPCVADVALEHLCEVRCMHPQTSHVFVCPALMTSRWRKQLGKVADVIVELSVGHCYWGKDEHEPLLIGLICPLLSYSPWIYRRHPNCQVSGDTLRGMQGENLGYEGDRLLKFWLRAWRHARTV